MPGIIKQKLESLWLGQEMKSFESTV